MRVCWQGQTGGGLDAGKRTAKGTLLFVQQGLTNVRKETGVSRSAPRKVRASLVQAQLPVHSQADLGGIAVLLAVVFPPANRAKPHGVRNLERSVSATGAAKVSGDSFHVRMDGKTRLRITGKRSFGRIARAVSIQDAAASRGLLRPACGVSPPCPE